MRTACAMVAAFAVAGCGTVDPGEVTLEPVTAAPDPDLFAREVQPILGASCGEASCHGGETGSFRLVDASSEALPERIAAPAELPPAHAANYRAASLRISFEDPDSSELVTKAAGLVPHGGEATLPEGTAAYETLLRWVRTAEAG